MRGGGFVVTVDESPSRLELTAPDDRVVDIHPVTFDADGTGVQAAIGSGSFRYAVDGSPGGRRLRFVDPAGNELAAWSH